VAQFAPPLGNRWVVVDGRRYGGLLPFTVERNLEAFRVLIKAADAMGQLRANQYVGATHLVVGDTTPSMRIVGGGTWNGAEVKVRMDWDYRVPGIRFETTRSDGAREIIVAAGARAWDEKSPGVFGGAAKTSAAERLVWAYLMPSAVILAGRDSADRIKLARDGAFGALIIPLPGLATELVATLDEAGRPVRTTIALGGKQYTGEFADFADDRGDYGVKFPHAVALKVDGATVADWRLDYHHAVPYLIFPVPKELGGR
jgi:hypothetical protein